MKFKKFKLNTINQSNQATQIEKELRQILLSDLIIMIKDWIIYFKSKLKLLIIFLFLGATLGFWISINDKPLYKASLSFAMEEDKGNSTGGISNALGLVGNLGIDIGGGGVFASSNLSELMKSRKIVTKVLSKSILVDKKKISMLEYYLIINKFKSKSNNIIFPSDGNLQNLDRKQDSIIQIIYNQLIDKKKLNIYQKDKKVSILTIEVQSENEIFSKNFCENLAYETSEFYIKTKSKKAQINYDVLQKQVDSIKKELNNSVYGVANEIDNFYNLNPSMNKKNVQGKKRQIDLQINSAMLNNLITQLEMSKIALRKETPLIQVIDDPKYPLEIIKLDTFLSTIIGAIIGLIIVIFYLAFIKIFLN